MSTLAEVAALYAAESKTRAGKRAHAGRMASSLRAMVANREGADPNRHRVTFAGMPHVSIRWARRHGYQATIAGAGVGPEGAGLILQRGDHTLIANVPCTLHWDGTRIHLEEQS